MDETTRTSLEMENKAAETIAKNGYDIEQNPIVNNSSRNPDYKIEGKIFDCYSPDTNTDNIIFIIFTYALLFFNKDVL